MKVGDIVRSTRIRPNETAEVIKADIHVKNSEERQYVSSNYVARYSDGTTLNFTGASINHTVFLYEDEEYKQMTMEEFFGIDNSVRRK